MIDSPPICCVCARRGIAELATWALTTETVENWTLCDRHASTIQRTTLNLRGKLTQLPDAVKTRQQSKEHQ